MLIEHPNIIIRKIWNATWTLPTKNCKTIYLTFDDGPNFTVTHKLLNILDQYNIKATFFCVGDNVRKYPNTFNDIINRGHSVGNHTMRHIKGFKHTTRDYLKDIELANSYIKSNLFRPPYGKITLAQLRELKKQYRVIFWDIITRDYDQNITPEKILKTIQKYARNGSIIVFHDSLKASKNMLAAIPPSIEWLLQQDYKFEKL